MCKIMTIFDLSKYGFIVEEINICFDVSFEERNWDILISFRKNNRFSRNSISRNVLQQLFVSFEKG